MQVDFAFLCDYADVSGKVAAFGIGIDTIYAPDVPCTHPLMHVLAQLRASVAESGRKDFKLALIDADGVELLNIAGPLEIKSGGGVEGVSRINVALNNVAFPHYGDYSLHLTIDGNEIHRIRFAVASPPSTN